MKSILKKNQVMITALAIMIAVAGYLNFAGTNLEKEEYLSASGEGVSNTATVEEGIDTLGELSEEELEIVDVNGIESLDEEFVANTENYLGEDFDIAINEVTPDEGEIPGEAVFANTSNVAALSEAKLLKEQTRAKNKEALLDIINSSELSNEQKQNAVDSMIAMTGIAEKETAAEILLEAKGFQDVVVSINGSGVDVVVNATELSDAQRAQIEDIVKRKTDIGAENIIISTVVQ